MQDWTSFYNCQQPEFVGNICGRHSLSEQMTPAENFAADFWQLTVLWCWHWLSDISVPVHFTPLITISVTLLLSQYHVSLDSGFRKQTNRRTKKKYSALIRKLKLQRVQCCRKTDVHDSSLAARWGHSVMLSLCSLEDDNFVQTLSESIITWLTGRLLNSTPLQA